MTRKAVLPDARDLHRRHMQGETLSAIAASCQVSLNTIIRYFDRSGLQHRPIRVTKSLQRGFSDTDLASLHARYMAGESSVDLAREIGCHSSTLRNAFGRHGFSVRTMTDAALAQASRATPAERRRRAEAAHKAVRGRVVSIDEKCARAITRQARPVGMSVPERRVSEVLHAAGYAPVFQRACGPYNIDFALVDTVAVEVFGGQWHGDGRHAARHPQRTRHLLNAGFDVVIVWVSATDKGGWVGALQHVVADLQRSDRSPAARRQYRVIGSRGEIFVSDGDSDEFPLEPTRVMREQRAGRHQAASR